MSTGRNAARRLRAAPPDAPRRLPERIRMARHAAGRSAGRVASRFLQGDDRGAVTVEFAIILPVVAAVAVLLLVLMRAIIVTLDCQESARTVARTIVIAGSDADPAAMVRGIGADGGFGGGVTVDLRETGDAVEVRTHCTLMPGPLDVLPASVDGFAVAIRQD